jgi:hypothetical protein
MLESHTSTQIVSLYMPAALTTIGRAGMHIHTSLLEHTHIQIDSHPHTHAVSLQASYAAIGLEVASSLSLSLIHSLSLSPSDALVPAVLMIVGLQVLAGMHTHMQSLHRSYATYHCL